MATALLINEIDLIPTDVAETLDGVLNNGNLPVVVGSGGSARTIVLPLPPIVYIGATNESTSLPRELRDCFELFETVSSDSVR